MSTFANGPRTLKGALVAFAPGPPVPQVIAFQYNPDTLTRAIKPRGPSGDGSRAEAQRLTGPPEETIKVDVEIDATDQLADDDPIAASLGIHPQLAALEGLVYPRSELTIANTALLAAGTIEVVPPTAPVTLFIWGVKRIVPVRITELSVTEEAHDPDLNPIRAKVGLGLRVLSTNDLSITDPSYYVFLAHQVAKEALAAVGTVSNVAAVTGGDVRLL